MTIEIPEQLRKNDFRFVLIEKDTKRPFEPKWTTENNYRFDDPKLLKHLEEVGSYGVMGGYGGLVILDIDNKDYVGEIVKLLPETFTVQTGGGGLHYYFVVDTPEKVIFDKDGTHIGEIQGPGAQCVGPGSIHPKTKKPYVVINDIPVAKLEQSVIAYLKEHYTPTQFKAEVPQWNQYHKTIVGDQLKILDLIDVSKLKRYGGEEFYGPHPVHGSSTGMNFFVNPTRNMWHCFRHNSGGDALAWLSIKEGICECSDFSPGGKKIKGADFIETLKIAKERHNVKVEEFTTQITNKDLLDYNITPQQIDQVSAGDLQLVYSCDVEGLPIQPAEYLVDKLIVRNAINYMVGKSGSYKSMTALHLAYCISEGRKAFGKYDAKQEKVWYMNEENTWTIFKQMSEGVRKGMNSKGSQNLIFSTYQNISFDITSIEMRTKVEKVIRDNKITVIFLDSFKRFFTFEENDADKVNKFYQIVLKPLIMKYNLTVILLHHTKKENAQFKFKTDKKDMIRGSSDFVNIADNILYFERSIKPLIFELYQLKCRVAEEFATKTMKIIADPIAGLAFEELTTKTEDSGTIAANACAMEIMDYLIKENAEYMSVANIKEFLNNRYKKTSVFNAVHHLMIEGVLIKTAQKGKYKVNQSNKLFVDLAADECQQELEKIDDDSDASEKDGSGKNKTLFKDDEK